MADILSEPFGVHEEIDDKGNRKEKITLPRLSEINRQRQNYESRNHLDRDALALTLQRALTAAQDEQDYDKAIHELNRLHPPLAVIVKRKTRRLGLLALIPLLVAMLHGCTLSTNINIDVNLLFDQAMVAIEHTEPYPFPQSRIEDQSSNVPGRSTTKQQQDSRSPLTKKRTKRSERRGGWQSTRRPDGSSSGSGKKNS